MKKYRVYWVYGVGLVLVTLIFPIFMNLILIPGTTQYGSKDAWIGFFGSFYGCILGGVIGGLFTYLGVRMTLLADKEKSFLSTLPAKVATLREMLRELDNRNESFEDRDFLAGTHDNDVDWRGRSAVIKFLLPYGLLVGKTTDKAMEVDREIYSQLKDVLKRVQKDLEDTIKSPEIVAKLCELEQDNLTDNAKGIRDKKYKQFELYIIECSELIESFAKNLEEKFYMSK